MKLPAPAPQLGELHALMRGDPTLLQRILAARVGPAPDGRWLHWDELRHTSRPSGLNATTYWLGVKLAREAWLRELPITDREGRPFRYALPESAQEALYALDRDARDEGSISEEIVNPDSRDRYLIRQLMEEAITSSQLEGAATSRAVAEELLRSGRPPRDLGERMIANNFQALRFVRARRGTDLTPEVVLELHRILTEGTLVRAEEAGALRASDDVVVRDKRDGAVLHVPPRASELPTRLRALCALANGGEPKGFLHPIVRAIAVHFGLAYDHPFTDGNGRTARALLYGSMLRDGYGLVEFLSVSSIVRRSPAPYRRAFLHSETDGGDITYFVAYHLDLLRRSIEGLRGFLSVKIAERRELEARVRRIERLNVRQQALVSHALRHPDGTYGIEAHRRSHGIVYQTARTDLLALERMGYLKRTKLGRRFQFEAGSKLESLRG